MNNTPDQLTLENFERLPALLTRSEFRHWTGLSSSDLDAGVADGSIAVWHRPGEQSEKRQRKYFKWQAGRFAGYIDNCQYFEAKALLSQLEQFGCSMSTRSHEAFTGLCGRIRSVLSSEWSADNVHPSRIFGVTTEK